MSDQFPPPPDTPMPAPPRPQPSPPPPPPPIDPLLRRRHDSRQADTVDQRPVLDAAAVAAAEPAEPAVRRRRPAAASKAASLVLSVAATVGLAAQFAREDERRAVAGPIDGPDDIDGAPTTIETTLPPADGGNVSPGSGPSSTAVSTDDGTVIDDGTYRGDPFTNRWGVVQVAITFRGGAIADVDVLRYPDSDAKSVSINQRALPRLEEAVLAAQSAEISSVTGATITSRSYRDSLQSAIDAALAASAG